MVICIAAAKTESVGREMTDCVIQMCSLKINACMHIAASWSPNPNPFETGRLANYSNSIKQWWYYPKAESNRGGATEGGVEDWLNIDSRRVVRNDYRR